MFKTQYDDHDRVRCEPGDRVHVTYGGHYDEKGRIVLEETGKIDAYAEIQSHAESVDLHLILERYASGDTTALSRAQGFFMDATDLPKDYASFLNRTHDAEMEFYQLPLDVREKFDNSFEQYLATAGSPEWLDKLGMVAQESAPAESPVSTEQKGE